VLLTFAVYGQTLKAGFVWDDEGNILRNPMLRSVAGLLRIWTEPLAVPQYYPMTYTTFWIEYRLWGLNPSGYHAVNVLLHASNAVLLHIVLRTLAVPGAWLAAAAFAVHPLHVESVAWVTERKNVLSTFFFLLAFHRFLAFRLTRSAGAYVGALGFYICALLSKSTACMMPVILLVILWWKEGRPGWNAIAPILPMMFLGACMALVTMRVETEMGAWGPEWSLGAGERMANAGRSLWFYVWKLIWPNPLMTMYPRWSTDPAQVTSYIYALSSAAVLSALWLFRDRIGKAPVTAAAVYAVMVFPSLGFIDFYYMRYSFVADHFIYPADAALLAAFASWLGRGRRRWVGCALLLGWACLTASHASVFRTEETLWRDTLRKNPQAWAAHIHLGLVESNRGDAVAAKTHFLAALKIDPGNPEANLGLGNLLLAEGDAASALNRYLDGLQTDPHRAETNINVARVLLDLNRLTEAEAYLSRALDLDPDHPVGLNNFGVLRARQGRLAEAMEYLTHAVNADPDYEDARRNYRTVDAALRKSRP